MAEVFLRRLSRWQADQQREAVADLYAAAYDGAAGHPERPGFLERFAHDMQRPGFDMLIAGNAVPVGCVYGYPELGPSGREFALAELMVLPAYRRDRIASRLLEALCARVSADVLTTRLSPGNTAAEAAYTSWGWTRTGRSDSPPLDIWTRRARSA